MTPEERAEFNRKAHCLSQAYDHVVKGAADFYQENELAFAAAVAHDNRCGQLKAAGRRLAENTYRLMIAQLGVPDVPYYDWWEMSQKWAEMQGHPTSG